MERLTVNLELKAVNAEGKVTFHNTLVQGEMKLSDTQILELVVSKAVRDIGKIELAKTLKEEGESDETVKEVLGMIS